jgi:hypothetical protein
MTSEVESVEQSSTIIISAGIALDSLMSDSTAFSRYSPQLNAGMIIDTGIVEFKNISIQELSNESNVKG